VSEGSDSSKKSRSGEIPSASTNGENAYFNWGYANGLQRLATVDDWNEDLRRFWEQPAKRFSTACRDGSTSCAEAASIEILNDRFKSLRSLDQPAMVPNEFDLKSYFSNAWGAHRGDQSDDVEILFTPDTADLVTETTWHPTQKLHRHRDEKTLRFRVDGLNEIVHWVLGWSGRARVLQPIELRELVVEYLRKALRLNGADGE
jgi:WYL domain